MLAILQPHIPHYRSSFFNGISNFYSAKFFTYENSKKTSFQKFQSSDISSTHLNNFLIDEFLLYNPFPFFNKNYDILVLMLHFGHITTWFLLFTKVFHKKKIILFGHGISVKRYIKEEKSPNILLKWMIQLSDGVWLYTTKEQEIWEKIFPNKNIVALGNTISDFNELIIPELKNKNILRVKYNIHQKTIFIFCARFSNPHRRTDLLLKAIEVLNRFSFGFIIIGDGPLKPDFSTYKNVYEFGAVYDKEVKSELFLLADIYFQPAWVGLSIVEALAYGKPVFTFKRSKEVLQCVEYSYIHHQVNGYIFQNFNEFIKVVNYITDDEVQLMSRNARFFAQKELNMDIMVRNAVESIKSIK